MHWLRPALLYLFVTLLLLAGLWLFWGDSIRESLKNSNTRNAGRELHSKMAGSIKEKTPTNTKPKPDEVAVKSKQGTISGKQAWEKASAGFALLLQNAAEENRRLLLESTAEHDRRFRGLFYKSAELKPAASAEFPATQPAEKKPNKPRGQRLIKSVEQRLPKLAERQPSAPTAK